MSSTSRTGCRTGFSREGDILPDTTHPAFTPYRDLLDRLPRERYPDAAELTSLLPGGVVSSSGAAIRFVPAESLPGADYEREIHDSGRVSTREGRRHDLFNALVWCRLPRLKVAMNALHYRHLDAARDGRRGPVRDALTLLDESGVLLVSSDRSLLEALAACDWTAAFRKCRGAWQAKTRVVVCGHALLEKLLDPYKAITAQALLFLASEGVTACSDETACEWLDRAMPEALLERRLLIGTGALSPLPLAGIPGWWSAADQDHAFYADGSVFRARRSSAVAAAVTALGACR